MDPRKLVVHLEAPYAACAERNGGAKEVVLAGLRWPDDYWCGLALSWLEQGAPIDSEVLHQLQLVASNELRLQDVRHRAFRLARVYVRGLPIDELDTVRIVELLTPARAFDGNDAIKRAPQVGDLGTVVHVSRLDSAPAMYIVEAVDANGQTLWVADFVPEELSLVMKHTSR